ncbi:hypothetical protein K461DRAFT_294002 [Myriangium duriaei CBS 260.36]|uniref:C2H2-type domain-containing protein n=1 Tax=Myriangium duriaei CBS 260.36 TaxID=1168546 RepID=A0A9P4IZ99_9PEZI|nr:hypothetical protein K461DRAFT_294002 [Myriangium duriaei CBS 260.36]
MNNAGASQSGVGQGQRLSVYNSHTAASSSTSPGLHQATFQGQKTAVSTQQYKSGRSPATQHRALLQDSRTAGDHTRMQSVTPSAIQQQAYNAPPPTTTTAPPLAHVTVEPSQVYDPYQERQRQAEKAAEERRKREAEEARNIAAQGAEEAKAAERKVAEGAKKKPIKTAKTAKKAREDRERDGGLDHAKQLSASAIDAAVSGKPDAADEMESEMRAMFQKMRQFNAMNPKMLAKLWEEERQAHVSKPGSTESSTASPAIQAPPAIAPTAVSTDASPGPATSTPKTATAKTKRAYVKKTPKATPATTTQAEAPGTATIMASQAPAITTTKATGPTQDQSQASAAASNQQPQGSTVWPSGRKQMLSEIAAKWLNSRKENSGKYVSPTSVAELLDGNPSYPNLCASIEQMGFTLDRGLFARTLLHACPDLNKPSTTTVNATAHPAPPAKPAVQATLVAEAAASSIASGVPQKTGGTSQAAPVVSNGSVAQALKMASPNTSILPQDHRMSIDGTVDSAKTPQQRFLTKEQAARKRNFSDLVDLTNEDDSDKDDFPPPKAPHLGQYHSFSLPPNTASPPPHKLLDSPAPMAPIAPMGNVEAPQYKGISGDAVLKGKTLVKPIVREKVARRSVYDPRTIARDILLATGRHPEMRALNGHLLYLQPLLADHSEGVEMHKYDLATIRWDLIDPGDPVESDEDVRSEDGSEADDESNGPSVRPTEATIRATSGSKFDGTATLSEAPLALPLPARASLKGGWRGRRGRPRNSAPGASVGNTLAGNSPEGGNNPFGTFRATPVNRTAGTGQPNSAPKQRIPSQGQSTSTPNNNNSTPGSAVGYAAFNQQNIKYDENGKPIKKKGRPVGWRKAIHSKEAQGLQSGGNSSNLPDRAAHKLPNGIKRRGRPPKYPSAASAASPMALDPQYSVWRCQWEGCHAELHNLDTLRKHVVKVHGIPDENGYSCQWGACSDETPHDHVIGKGKAPAELSRLEFPSIHKWMNHIEAAHLRPLARSLGDGPRSGLSDAYDSESSQAAYLSDAASGRMVTPRATPLADVPEAAAADASAQASPLAPVLRRGMPRVRGVLSDRQREDEYKLQQLEAKKLALGPLLDRAGARLASDGRRKGLYDDEDFEGSFSEDDGPTGDEEGDEEGHTL